MKPFVAVVALLAALTVAAPTLASGPGGPAFITDTLAPGGGAPSPYAVRAVRAETQGYRFITDTLAPGGGDHGGPTYVTAPNPAAFRWGDAAVGASAGAGILLVLMSTLLVARRVRVAV